LGKTELPSGLGDVGSLLDRLIRLDIASCGTPTIVAHQGVRYIQPSSGETGVLWLGRHHSNGRRRKETPDERPSWMVTAAKQLTKYPYSLLFSVLDLVTEAQPGETLDPWVAPEKVLAWCTMYGLPEAETWHSDERYGCLRLDRFQSQAVNLYLLFHLWKAVVEWRVFQEGSGPSDPDEAEKHRGAIHYYSELLLRLHDGGSGLGHAIAVEQHLKQQLDRGIYEWVNPKTKKVVNLKKEYNHAKDNLDHLALVTIDDEIYERGQEHPYLSAVTERIILLQQQLHRGIDQYVKPEPTSVHDLKQAYTAVKAEVDRLVQVARDARDPCRQGRPYLSGATGQIILQARSVFDACYFQLGQLMLKPADEVARHLKDCAVRSCGRVFWADHGHEKFCGRGNHNRKAQWAQKRAKRPRRGPQP
jgi:hypothetical protein